jgi:hypothetical protein
VWSAVPSFSVPPLFFFHGNTHHVLLGVSGAGPAPGTPGG